MPELPEVEHLRRSLDPWLVGATFESVDIRRKGVVTLGEGSRRSPEAYARALLVGTTIARTRRHGKQMAFVGADGRALVVQLGMTGSVTIESGREPRGVEARHRHVRWTVCRGGRGRLEGPEGRGGRGAAQKATRDSEREVARVVFRDPRRFGGLRAYDSELDLDAAWSELGPDALTISDEDLKIAIDRTTRAIKVALLDQALIAGVGNIYADEALFASRIHPETPAREVTPTQSTLLAAELRRILGHAVEAGGSTLRDYRDAFGQPGNAVQSHAAYGRAHQPCLRCGSPLRGFVLGGRTTVCCERCQRRPTDLST
jgi:formamidopyrimidine-DNA glycosylase